MESSANCGLSLRIQTICYLKLESHVLCHVVLLTTCLVGHAAAGKSINICQEFRVGHTVQEEGMRVGKGKCYNREPRLS